MKILQLSTYDGGGGAAIAARRLHLLLREVGHESYLVVKEIVAGTPGALPVVRDLPDKLREGAREVLDQLPLRLYPARKPDYFSPGIFSTNLAPILDELKPDVIHLHWALRGFVSPLELSRYAVPVVWTLHDAWAFTGGCHYPGHCARYKVGCGKCPALGGLSPWDLSRWDWHRKRKAYRTESLRLIAPSRWLEKLATESTLLAGVKIQHIPNPIDTRVFRVIDRAFAKSCFPLPDDLPLIVCGAASEKEYRKGFDLIEQALRHYDEQPQNPEIGFVLFGAPANLPTITLKKIRVIELGRIEDEISLNLLYNAVDALVLPSREENASLTLAEALCCGTSCVAFNVGGNGEFILHQVNGYLAQPLDVEDLSRGISWVVANASRLSRREVSARTGQLLSPATVIPKIIAVYENALCRATT
jgi:glycosyltransferase involved in cell wall biosynthesis